MKANQIKLLIIALMVLFSCQKIERNNPFDPECPSQLWAPTNFQAVQEGNAVKLTWNIPVTNISGIKVYRQINHSGDFIEITELKKDATQWIDSEIVGGKVHSYFLVAFAGKNESNSGSTQVTPIIQATISTTTPSIIGTISATFGGTITSDGGSTVTEKGVCWATSPNPTVNNGKVAIGDGVGSFSQPVFGLASNTKYYLRAYALNSRGVSYGNEVSIVTKGYGTITDIDGNLYKTIIIGTQEWMVENLKTTKYNDGTPIPNVTAGTSWSKLSSGAFCWYNNDASSYKTTYGALYNGFAVKTDKLAPLGWHVPSDTEWTILTDYLGGHQIAGGRMKESGTLHWKAPNTDATNISGFTGLAGGLCDSWQGFYNVGEYGYWWSSTPTGSKYATSRYLIYGNGTIAGGESGSASPMQDGFSVRCIKN